MFKFGNFVYQDTTAAFMAMAEDLGVSTVTRLVQQFIYEVFKAELYVTSVGWTQENLRFVARGLKSAANSHGAYQLAAAAENLYQVAATSNALDVRKSIAELSRQCQRTICEFDAFVCALNEMNLPSKNNEADAMFLPVGQVAA